LLVALIAAIVWIAEIVIISTPTLAQAFNLSFFHKWDLVKFLASAWNP
jgi:hypothetical protein